MKKSDLSIKLFLRLCVTFIEPITRLWRRSSRRFEVAIFSPHLASRCHTQFPIPHSLVTIGSARRRYASLCSLSQATESSESKCAGVGVVRHGNCIRIIIAVRTAAGLLLGETGAGR